MECALFLVFQSFLEQLKAGDAVPIQHDRLAVEHGGADAEARDGLGQTGEAVGPVLAVAGEQPHILAVLAGEQAVAVELDLVNPGLAGRRVRREGAELRRVEVGELCTLRAVEVGKVRRCLI